MVVATSVLVISVLGYVASVTAGDRLMLQNRESRAAYIAAQTVFSEMQACSMDTVFQRYNANANDNPAGVSSSPGATFTPRGCSTASGSSNAVGRVRFPSADGATLREDIVDASLGMPRDLDGDGVISSGALSNTPIILPVEISVTWPSSGGTRTISVRKFLFAGGTP